MPTNVHELDSSRDSEFLNQERRDPVTLESFQPGDQVVVCAECEVAHLASTWREREECVSCGGSHTLSRLPETAELDLTQDGPADGPVSPPARHRSSGSTEIEAGNESEQGIGLGIPVSVFALLLLLSIIAIIPFPEKFTSSKNTDEPENTERSTQSETIDSPPPTAKMDQASTLEGEPLVVNVLSNDVSHGDGYITIKKVGVVHHGNADKLGNGKVQYTPSPGFAGTAYMFYTISDEHGQKDKSYAVISVNPNKSRDITKSSNILVWREAGLRNRPSRDSEILTWISSGEKVEFVWKIGDFYRIHYKGKTGYLHKGLIHPEFRR